jgi:AspT/YidE/YbjL antiporter-like protein
VIDLLLGNPLILLFTVIAIGYPLGRVRIAGVSLGVAAVLFTGLAVGALHPDMKLPELVYQLGLVLFVYTVGLSNGSGFFASFRRRGVRDNLFVACLLIFAALLAVLVGKVLHLRPALAAGVFTADNKSNRQEEYDPPTDKYSKVITDELLPAVYKDYKISRDPDRHGFAGWSSGAIASGIGARDSMVK